MMKLTLLRPSVRLIRPSLVSLSTRLQSTVAKPPEVFTPEQKAWAANERIKGLGILKHLPEKWIPYGELMRLEKPVGTWLLFIPGTWSILMAACQTGAPLLLTVKTLALFGVGSIVMRGFGCVVNDLLDKDLDNKVLRTIERPITSGRVTKKQAYKLMAGQLTVGLGILLALPSQCYAIGALSLIPVCLYPLFKRFTYYPQAMLSLTFNWAAILGFPAMGIVDPLTLGSLYLSTFCWTMTYDTIYAHQDKKFDIQAGVKSTALAWQDKSKIIFTGLTTAQMGLLALSGYHSGLLFSPGFAIGSAMFLGSVYRMIYKVDLNNPADCWKYFVRNIRYGLYLTLGLALDYLIGWSF